MEYRYNAIVLKKREIGETDRLYILYTEEQGKIRVVAKGVRKPEAKLAGQLETLMQGLVIVVKGKGMGKIAGAVAENIFPALRGDLETLQPVLGSIALFERLVDLEEPDPELFSLLARYLLLVEDFAKRNMKEKVEITTLAFLFQFLSHLGYRIETGTCAVSGERLRPGEQHFFSPSAGGILSGEHIHSAPQAFPISENAIKLIRVFLGNRLENIGRLSASARECAEVRQVATRFLQWIGH
ncbi:MAG: DNA repair protein RecO [Patescibacteria group bacterium]